MNDRTRPNPWLELPMSAPYVLPDDAGYVDAWNRVTGMDTFTTNTARSASVSPGNLPPGAFDQLIEAVSNGAGAGLGLSS